MELTERQNDWQVVQAMKHYGGSFVKGLAELWFLADSDNQEKIKRTWVEYWKEYSDMAADLRVENGKDWWDR